jgi:hypothetical protein
MTKVKMTSDSNKSGSKHNKVYNLPGQRKDTPSTSDPVCRFYTSLLRQNKSSRMALVWCMERGLLDKSDAERLVVQLKMEKLSISKKSS